MLRPALEPTSDRRVSREPAPRFLQSLDVGREPQKRCRQLDGMRRRARRSQPLDEDHRIDDAVPMSRRGDGSERLACPHLAFDELDAPAQQIVERECRGRLVGSSRFELLGSGPSNDEPGDEAL